MAGGGFPGWRLWDALAGGRAGRGRQGAAAEAVWDRLREFDMAGMADSLGSELSGGQRRLVEIMRCLMQSPRGLLLGGPMGGVAPHLVRRISGDCARSRDSAVCIIILQHTPEAGP